MSISVIQFLYCVRFTCHLDTWYPKWFWCFGNLLNQHVIFLAEFIWAKNASKYLILEGFFRPKMCSPISICIFSSFFWLVSLFLSPFYYSHFGLPFSSFSSLGLSGCKTKTSLFFGIRYFKPAWSLPLASGLLHLLPFLEGFGDLKLRLWIFDSKLSIFLVDLANLEATGACV